MSNREDLDGTQQLQEIRSLIRNPHEIRVQRLYVGKFFRFRLPKNVFRLTLNYTCFDNCDRSQNWSKICKEYLKDGAIWKNLSMDWVHLLLLSITGNALLEAVGRQEPYSWQSKLCYRFSKLYIAMSVILWFASLSHQFAMWIAVEKRLTHNLVLLKLGQEEKTKEQVASGTPVSTTPAKKKYKDPLKKLKKILDLNLDWQWQPIITQVAILFCLWAFLTFVNGDETSGTILGFLLQAASPWSLLYSFRVGFKTMPSSSRKRPGSIDKLRLVYCKCGCGKSQSEIEKQEVA